MGPRSDGVRAATDGVGGAAPGSSSGRGRRVSWAAMTDGPAPTFAPDVVTAICRHMNGDHADDCLRMVQGLGGVDATAATMTGLDGDVARFSATTPTGEVEVVLPWSARLTERAQVRTEVVRMHEQACRELGIELAAGDGH